MLWRYSRFIPNRGFSFCNTRHTVSPHSKEFFDKHNVWGLLSSIDIRNCDPNKIRDPKAIEQYVIQLCKLIDMKRFGPCTVVNFGENEKVAGYSMVQLIETSCISGHFANSTNTSYIDIFSCKYYNPEIASKFTADFFGSNDYVFNVLTRR
jgi:S-adenosylmethionine/arginine decarboxylase-like enzyme